MKVIGITGGTGAGKTTLLNYLETLGAYIIDCDAVYHELLNHSAAMKKELDERFPGIVRDGSIDRKELGRAVFGDETALEDLNAITHKFVSDEVMAILRREKLAGREIVGIDAILLIESGLGELCNRIVGVLAPESRRLSRIMARDGIDETYALSRIRSQKPDSFFVANCDMILENDYNDTDSFYPVCAEFMQALLGDITKEEEY